MSGPSQNDNWTGGSAEWSASNGNWSAGIPNGANYAVTLSNGGTITVGSGDYSATAGTFTLNSGAVLVTGGSLNLGSLAVNAGSFTINSDGSVYLGTETLASTYGVSGNVLVAGDGTLTVENGVNGAVTGTVTLETGGSYYWEDVLASSSSGQTVDFADGNGSLFYVQDPFSGNVQNFQAGDSIQDSYGTGTATHSFGTNSVTVTMGGQSITIKFTGGGTYNSSNVSVSSSGLITTSYQPPAPEVGSSTYNAATGQLVVSDGGAAGFTAGLDPTQLTITGEDGATYTLTGGVVNTYSSSSFTVTLTGPDQLQVDGLLDKNGTASTGNDIFNQSQGATTYSIGATASFDTGGRASTGTITVSNALAPTITSANYNSTTKVLTLTGTGFENSGDYGGVNLGQITLKNSAHSYTFNADSYANAVSETQITIDLSNTTTSSQQSITTTDATSATAILAGTSLTLAATSGWDAGAGAAITSQSISGSVGTPTANAQSDSINFDTGKSITLTGSDPDTPALSLTYAIGTGPAHGTLSNFNASTGAVTYTPTAGYHGTDSFTFTDNNGTNTSTAATVTLTVAVSTPTANAQSDSVSFNTAKNITLTGSDPDTPALSQTYAIGTGPAHGTLSNFNASTGAVTYTPNAGYAGTDSFTFTDSNGTNTSSAATVSLTVAPGPATHFVITALPSSQTAGVPENITVTAYDAAGNVATGYTGTVHFTSTDTKSGSFAPANYMFTTNDAGTHTFDADVAFVTAGPETVTATDTINSSITGTSSIDTVSPGPATHFVVTAPSSGTPGVPGNVTVTAEDAFGNTATGYTGTVHFTSTDGQAVLPADTTLTNGTGTFSETLDTSGNQSITATDTVSSSITGTSNSDAVSLPTVTLIDIVGTSPNNASSDQFTVTFSTPVTGVDATDFSLVETSTVAGAITTVVPVGTVGGFASTYTVTVGSVTGDGTLRLDLVNNGDPIKDQYGNTLFLAHTGDQSYTIETTPPAVTSAAAAPDTPPGTYGIGQTIDLDVTFSEVVTVSGTPEIAIPLTSGGTAEAAYLSGSGSNTLVFRYTVGSGQQDLSGITPASAITLNGGSIEDAATNNAVLTLNDVAIAGVDVQGIPPVVTSANISVSGATGTGGAFKIGDTVTASWNDSASGDANTDTINAGGVTVNFVQFGGGAAVVATDSGGIWTASYTISSGSVDTTSAHAAVTVTDAFGNTTTTSGGAVTVDDIFPMVISGHISATGGTGTAGAFIIGDTVTATWSDTPGGGDNADTFNAGGVTFDFSAFGGGAAVVATDSGNIWTATDTISAGNIDTSSARVAVTATDIAGNSTTTEAATAVTVDDIAPTIAITTPIATSNTINLADAQAGVTVSGTTTGVEIGNIVTVDLVNASGVPAFLGSAVVGANGSWSTSLSSALAESESDGAYTVTANVSDDAGNAATEASQAITIDETRPRVASITTVGPSLTNTSSVAFTVTFTEAVTGVSGADFGIPDTGAFPVETLTIPSVTGGGTTWTVTVGGLVGNGTLGLELFADAPGIVDAAGNAIMAPFSTNAALYTIDQTPPVVAAAPTITAVENSSANVIGIAAPSDNDTPVGSLVVTVTGLPTDGTVTLADGVTAVTLNEALTPAQLEGLEFTPTQGAYSQSSTLSYAVADLAGNVTAGSAMLDIGAPLVPTIAATHSDVATGSMPLAPFGGVVINDPSSGTTDTVTITLYGLSGTLAGTGLSGGANGVYTLNGTGATVTTEIDALVFTPAGIPNTTTTGTFVIADVNNVSPVTTLNGATTVIDTVPAAGSMISATLGPAVTSTHPFAKVAIADPNGGTGPILDTLTITQVGPGTLTGSGLVPAGAGLYTLSGSATAVTSALEALTLAGGSQATSFVLSDANNVFGGGAALADLAVTAAGGVSGTVLSSGTLIVGSNAIVAGEGVAATTVFEVLSGGTATSTIVSSGGIVELFAGAHVSGLTTSPGASVDVEYGYTLGVASGQTIDGAVVLSGGAEVVSAGGSASGSLVSSGGLIALAGTAVGTIVSAGGISYVSSGGTDGSATLFGVEVISAGGFGSATQLATGATELAYGQMVSASVGGGTLVLETGGTASGTTITAGGAFVSSGAVDSGAVVSGGAEIVSAGGSSLSAAVLAGATELVFGFASGAALRGGTFVVEGGGTGSGTNVSGGDAYVYAGGLGIGTRVSGGAEIVSAGGTASATTLYANTTELLFGSAVSASLQGGTLVIEAGGIASGIQVSSGGEFIYAGGLDVGATLVGGAQIVSAGGTASGTVLSSGTTELDFGSAFGTILRSGTLVVEGSAVASGATISAGASFISAGGLDQQTILSGGAEVVSSGGTALRTTLLSNTTEFVFGSAVSGSVQGGSLVVEAAGYVGNAVVSSGGEFVYSGGTDGGTTLVGGAEIVSAGGVASNTVLSSGTTELDYGSAASATLLGGNLVVEGGARASGSVISSGAEFVSSGGIDSGTTLYGGAEVVSSGATINGTINFAGSSGLLIVNQASNFGAGALVAGFTTPSDVIDLRNIAYANTPTIGFTEAGNALSGTLTVAAGGITDTLTLIGQYSTANFTAVADGVGGTAIIDPPVTTSAAIAQPHV